MPKVDARFETKPYSKIFLAMHDPNSHEPAVGGAYNSIAKCSIEDGSYEYWSAGNSTALHEVAFVPRSEDGKSTDLFDTDILPSRGSKANPYFFRKNQPQKPMAT